MAMGPKIWSKTRQIISQELSNETSDFRIFSNVLIPLKDVNLFMLFTVSDYTDFMHPVNMRPTLALCFEALIMR